MQTQLVQARSRFALEHRYRDSFRSNRWTREWACQDRERGRSESVGDLESRVHAVQSSSDGSLQKLSANSVDTGMGLTTHICASEQDFELRHGRVRSDLQKDRIHVYVRCEYVSWIGGCSWRWKSRHGVQSHCRSHSYSRIRHLRRCRTWIQRSKLRTSKSTSSCSEIRTATARNQTWIHGKTH